MIDKEEKTPTQLAEVRPRPPAVATAVFSPTLADCSLRPCSQSYSPIARYGRVVTVAAACSSAALPSPAPLRLRIISFGCHGAQIQPHRQ